MRQSYFLKGLVLDFNKDNFKLVLDHIKAHPSQWDQRDWHCGTSHCFFGFAQVLSGKEQLIYRVWSDAKEFLDIKNPDFAGWLTDVNRTLADFNKVLKMHGQTIYFLGDLRDLSENDQALKR